MPRQVCKICSAHPDIRLEIEKHIIDGSLSRRKLATQYSEHFTDGITESGIRRHEHNHMSRDFAAVMMVAKQQETTPTVQEAKVVITRLASAESIVKYIEALLIRMDEVVKSASREHLHDPHTGDMILDSRGKPIWVASHQTIIAATNATTQILGKVATFMELARVGQDETIEDLKEEYEKIMNGLALVLSHHPEAREDWEQWLETSGLIT